MKTTDPSSKTDPSPLRFLQAVEEFSLYDLRQGLDLLCPLSLFRAALDIEVIPLLTALNGSKSEDAQESSSERSQKAAHRQLQAFIHRIGQAYPEAFLSQ